MKTAVISNDILEKKSLIHYLSREPLDIQDIDYKSLHETTVWQNMDLVISFCHNDEDINLLKKIKKEKNKANFVFIVNGLNSFSKAVDLMQAGAYYCFEKPFDMEKLKSIIAGIHKNNLGERNHTIMTEPHIKGISKAAKILYRNIDLVATTNYNILLSGESGTGKESIARQIHEQSNRAAAPFIAIDCGCLTPELAASELFGHEKGAFTGAIASKTGAFESAANGTLFLDEISNLSFELQALLLRAIQEKAIRRIGTTTERPVDIRIIAATNSDMELLVRNHEFREDLYYRLNEFSLVLPALRERQEDIMLIAHALKTAAAVELNKPIGDFSEDVVNTFLKYKWSGNIRELKNVIRRMCLLSEPNKILHTSLLPNEVAIINSLPDPEGAGLKKISQEAELKKIWEVLKLYNFNKTKAAKALQITRKTLYNKLHT